MTDEQTGTEVRNPAYARSYDTPYYRLIEKTEDYELREYEETKWVITDINSKTNRQWEKTSETRNPFWTLFNYIAGKNSAGMKIPMTVPVRMEYSPKHIDMAFMVPHQVDKPPEPDNPNVRVICQPQQKVYVRSFSGWGRGFFGNKNYFEDHATTLKTALQRDSKKYDNDKFYTAQYNDPWTIFNRHNEVWLAAL